MARFPALIGAYFAPRQHDDVTKTGVIDFEFILGLPGIVWWWRELEGRDHQYLPYDGTARRTGLVVALAHDHEAIPSVAPASPVHTWPASVREQVEAGNSSLTDQFRPIASAVIADHGSIELPDLLRLVRPPQPSQS